MAKTPSISLLINLCLFLTLFKETKQIKANMPTSLAQSLSQSNSQIHWFGKQKIGNQKTENVTNQTGEAFDVTVSQVVKNNKLPVCNYNKSGYHCVTLQQWTVIQNKLEELEILKAKIEKDQQEKLQVQLIKKQIPLLKTTVVERANVLAGFLP